MEFLNKYFEYDETSPTYLKWKEDLIHPDGRVLKKKGQLVDTKPTSAGYYLVSIKKNRLLVHRIVCYLFDNSFEITNPSVMVDHIDGNRLNNKIDNLRVGSRKLNQCNMRPRKTSKTGINGITLEELVRKDGTLYRRFRAGYVIGGKMVQKSFPIDKYESEQNALIAAVRFRVEGLFSNGELPSYTERHLLPDCARMRRWENDIVDLRGVLTKLEIDYDE